MLLSELQVGDKLIVKSYYKEDEMGNSRVSFETTVTKVFPSGILVEEIRSPEGNPINFDSNIISSEMIRVEENRSPVLWENIIVKRLVTDTVSGHIIVCKTSGHKINRRAAYRVSVGANAIARLGLSRKTANVIVRDVSSTGFGLILDTKNEMKKGDSVRVTFDDDGSHMVLNGIVVRKKTIDEERALYGCVLEKRDPEVDAYVTKKQRGKVGH